MAAKNKRRFSILPWFLLLVVGCGWYLDAATRPAPDPFLTRLGTWMINMSKSTEEGDVLVGAGTWLVNFSTGALVKDVDTATLTTGNDSHDPALWGRWELIGRKYLDGSSARRIPECSFYIEFGEHGNSSLVGANQDGIYTTDTYYWDVVDGSLRISDKLLFLGGATNCEYTVQGNLLTIRYSVPSGSGAGSYVAYFLSTK